MELFLIFAKIGLFTFGGGYAMISLIENNCVEKKKWITHDEMMNITVIAESTPGPIAINMATFIGASQAGIVGSALATLGVVMPSFIVILLIAALARRFLENRFARAFLSGVRPTVLGLIIATAATMMLSVVFNFTRVGGNFDFDLRSAIIFLVLCALPPLFRRVFKKRLSPILLILISAGLGMLVFGVFA